MALIFEVEKWKRKGSLDMTAVVLKTNALCEIDNEDMVIFTFEHCSRNHWLVTNKAIFEVMYKKIDE